MELFINVEESRKLREYIYKHWWIHALYVII